MSVWFVICRLFCIICWFETIKAKIVTLIVWKIGNRRPRCYQKLQNNDVLIFFKFYVDFRRFWWFFFSRSNVMENIVFFKWRYFHNFLELFSFFEFHITLYLLSSVFSFRFLYYFFSFACLFVPFWSVCMFVVLFGACLLAFRRVVCKNPWNKV